MLCCEMYGWRWVQASLVAAPDMQKCAEMVTGKTSRPVTDCCFVSALPPAGW
jgi:hypothetical protein